MKALDRKLLRDLRLMWSQALTIALVVASGIGGFITTLSAVDSLGARARPLLRRGPLSPTSSPASSARPTRWPTTLRALPGVADVQTTTEMAVRIEIEGCQRPDHRPADRHRPRAGRRA